MKPTDPPTRPLPEGEPRAREGGALVSRRRALLLGGVAIGALAGATPGAAQLMLPVGDLAKLVRRLLAARRDGVSASKRIRLEDDASPRRAVLQIADDGGGTLALLLIFPIAGEPLHVHTVSIGLDDGESLYLTLFRVPPEGRAGQEIVGAQLEEEDLERLADATRVVVVARGWDQTFEATLDEQELEKIRRYRASRRAASDRP
ncbi:MAG TPA: hypothetical protein VMV46_05530 [Thermoanaerobaculia bacterium]|nr:hypothetical protein [Thermoanaerobaculia bacterium]